jgi:hypothetical protein
MRCSGLDVMYYRGAFEDLELPQLGPTGRKRPATATGPQPKHLPQRIFLVVTINTIGAAGPVILQKPVADLGKDYIVVIKFRDVGHVPSLFDPELGTQLWLYDPKLVTSQMLWQKYYVDVLPLFVRRIRVGLSVPAALTPVPPQRPVAIPVGSTVAVQKKPARANTPFEGKFIVIKIERNSKREEIFTLIDAETKALQDDVVPAKRVRLVHDLPVALDEVLQNLA